MHWQSDALTTGLDLIATGLDLVRTGLDLIPKQIILIFLVKINFVDLPYLICFDSGYVCYPVSLMLGQKGQRTVINA